MFDTAMVHSMVQCGDTTMLSELDKRLRFLGLTFEEQQEEVKAKKTTTTLSVIRGNRDAKAKKAKAGRAAS